MAKNEEKSCLCHLLPLSISPQYRDSSPNVVLSNTDFAETRFWFRDKKMRIYTVISAISRSSAIFLCLCIVQSQSPPTTVRFRLTSSFFWSQNARQARTSCPLWWVTETGFWVRTCSTTIFLQPRKVIKRKSGHFNIILSRIFE